MRRRGISALGCAILLCGLISACATTIEGTAVRAGGPAPADVPQLSESDLERVLIRASAVNGIMGARGMEVVASSEDLSDNSDVVSDRDCLGAIYGAEKLVYGGSDWIAIRDQVVQEPNDDNQHWVEQIAVLYPSAAKARNFVEESKAAWQQCAGKSVDIDNGDVHSTWDLGDFRAEEAKSGLILTQLTEQRHAGGWGCQHALTSVSNVVVEAWACSNSIQDEAAAIVGQMQKNAQ
ncbi:MAG: sensor domain-containing protein [Mycobacterium sp.]